MSDRLLLGSAFAVLTGSCGLLTVAYAFDGQLGPSGVFFMGGVGSLIAWRDAHKRYGPKTVPPKPAPAIDLVRDDPVLARLNAEFAEAVRGHRPRRHIKDAIKARLNELLAGRAQPSRHPLWEGGA